MHSQCGWQQTKTTKAGSLDVTILPLSGTEMKDFGAYMFSKNCSYNKLLLQHSFLMYMLEIHIFLEIWMK